MGVHVPMKLILDHNTDHPQFSHALRITCEKYVYPGRRVLLQGCLYIFEQPTNAGVSAAEHLR